MADANQINAMFLDRTPLGRLGQPRDIATVVSFLVSPEAGWVTGQVIQAAGGCGNAICLVTTTGPQARQPSNSVCDECPHFLQRKTRFRQSLACNADV